MSNWTDPRAVEQPHEFIDLSGFSGSGVFYKESTKPFQTGYEYLIEYNLLFGGSGSTNNDFDFHLINSSGFVRDGSTHYVKDGSSSTTQYVPLAVYTQNAGEVSGRLHLFNAAESSIFSHFFWTTAILKDLSPDTEELGQRSAHCTVLEAHTKFRIRCYTTTFASGSYMKVTKRKILL